MNLFEILILVLCGLGLSLVLYCFFYNLFKGNGLKDAFENAGFLLMAVAMGIVLIGLVLGSVLDPYGARTRGDDLDYEDLELGIYHP